MYRRFFKRLIDILVSAVLILLFSPVLIVTAILLYIQNKGAVFFIQARPGKNEAVFNIIKFKTMTDAKDANGVLLPDNQRITALGRIIRKLSIDELPQLFNVLKGDMSLIGPRPLLIRYLPLYNEDQKKRHLVRPGITGLAQVSGRNAISWKEKFAYDVYYVTNLSFWLDVKIAFLTVVKVLKREGVNQSDQRPMQPFTGDN
ncbi:MAG TPA: sugar transferase [Flavihumibacter sp.]|jgi:undecaprenyl phosphate N,N'-diacetylbacillosamine 1-phosphate transferase